LAKIPASKGKLESRLLASGLVAGVDEVGRGCIAGPVYTGAAVLDFQLLNQLDSKTKELIRDSKTLSKKQRAAIIPVLKEISISFAVGKASAREIEKKGIVPATFLAMHRAIAALEKPFKTLLVDGNQLLPEYRGSQRSIIKGDSLCFSIAAASIFAKEARDQYMTNQAKKYPQYGFETHVGYGTKKHIDSIIANGICPLHRKNFAPVSSYC
jgi:ribonuclease HII